MKRWIDNICVVCAHKRTEWCDMTTATRTAHRIGRHSLIRNKMRIKREKKKHTHTYTKLVWWCFNVFVEYIESSDNENEYKNRKNNNVSFHTYTKRDCLLFVYIYLYHTYIQRLKRNLAESTAQTIRSDSHTHTQLYSIAKCIHIFRLQNFLSHSDEMK